MTPLQKMVLASNNAAKAKEMFELFEPLGITLVSQREFAVPEAEETGLTFVENALLKARNACHYSGLPAIADDSGIEVDALGGAPGIFSARFAGPQASDADNNLKLLASLGDLPAEARTARYRCVMVFLRHANDAMPLIAQGTWEGEITTDPSGSGGFGYDPLFYLPGRDLTAAQLTPELKNLISHRGKAVRQLVHLLDEGRNPTGSESIEKLY